MKNKKLIVVLGVSIVLVLAGGGYFLLSGKNTAPAPTTSATSQVQDVSEQAIPTLTPSDLGLSLTANSNTTKVTMVLTKTSDVSTIDYELSYTAKGDIPRGIIGQVIVKPGKSVSQEITLGTCSDVCHYDQDVTGINLVLKITKTNGKTYQVEKSLD
ncbi:MAG: hypothetical protein Q7R31_03055 [Candidatus Levybacteria bacterium]|nr:hypothetical protein [Candidatus Levybacteria bacterium]